MMTRILRAIALAVCLGAAQPAAAEPAPNQLTAQQWRDDLAFMVADMRQRHPNLYHSVTKAKFDATVADLDARIPTMNRNQIIVGMMRIAALIGDGHTRLDPRKDASFNFPSLPVKLYAFDDGLFIRAATPAQAALVGARVEAIGGVPADQAMDRVKPLISHDNRMAYLLFGPLYLAMPDILNAVGLSDRSDRATLTLSRGSRRWTVQLAAGAIDPMWPPDTDISLVTPAGWVDAHKGSPPMWLQAPLDYHRLFDLPERKAVYAQLNMVSGTDEETIGQFAAKIRQHAEAIHARRIILDLRLDFGGNGNLRTGLVRELIKAEDSDTRLFVLTARGSFSATQFILNDLDRLTDAVFIGEPASSKPSSYGDAYKSNLPNSGIAVRTSILFWQDGQDFDPWTWVDVAAPLTFADYVAGRDPALERALNYEPPQPLEDLLYEAARDRGLSGARTVVKSYVADPEHRYADLERLLPRAAELVFPKGHSNEAVTAAQAVAEALPKTVDSWVVLAYVALKAGNAAVARDAAQHAIALDPNQRTAKDILEKASAPKS